MGEIPAGRSASSGPFKGGRSPILGITREIPTIRRHSITGSYDEVQKTRIPSPGGVSALTTDLKETYR